MKSSFAHALSAALLIGGLSLALILAFTISRHRNYQVDEIEHIHSAFNVHQGQVLYRDFWEGHNPLLYAFLQPFIDPNDPAATFGDARAMMFIVLLAIVGCAAFVAHRLAGIAAAMLASGLLLTHTTFVERAIEIRPDPFLALGVVVVLAIELTHWSALRRFICEAAALSLVFLVTQKAVIVVAAVGLNWAVVAWRSRKVSYVLLPSFIWAIPVAVAAYWVWAIGAGPKYIEYNLVNQARHVERASNLAFSPWASLVTEGGRNLFFSGLGLFGVGYSAVRVWLSRAAPERCPRKLPIVVFIASFTVASLWLNPFPFPYFHVIALPSVAVLAACSLLWITQRWQAERPWVGFALGVSSLTLALSTSLPRLLDKAVDRTSYQLQFIDQVDAVTPPGSAVFDLAGLHFRKDPYPVYVMTMTTIKRYRGGAYPRIVPLLHDNRVATVVANYRTQSLGVAEGNFISTHFTPYTSMVLLPGQLIRGLRSNDIRPFEVLESRIFRFEGSGRLLVDGREFQRGSLGTGVHMLGTPEMELNGTLIVDVPPPSIDDSSLAGLLYPTFD
jgi:hypothetical protein